MRMEEGRVGALVPLDGVVVGRPSFPLNGEMRNSFRTAVALAGWGVVSLLVLVWCGSALGEWDSSLLCEYWG